MVVRNVQRGEARIFKVDDVPRRRLEGVAGLARIFAFRRFTLIEQRAFEIAEENVRSLERPLHGIEDALTIMGRQQGFGIGRAHHDVAYCCNSQCFVSRLLRLSREREQAEQEADEINKKSIHGKILL